MMARRQAGKAEMSLSGARADKVLGHSEVGVGYCMYASSYDINDATA